MKDHAAHHEKEQLLIVEPDTLLRWSLDTYLSRWFCVISTDSFDQANSILDQNTFNAVVIFDDHVNPVADNIEHHARQRNSHIRVVRTVMNYPKQVIQKKNCSYIEKPFNLSTLADLLGVEMDSHSIAKGNADVH